MRDKTGRLLEVGQTVRFDETKIGTVAIIESSGRTHIKFDRFVVLRPATSLTIL